ncbi:hypothetical protein [Lactobacillus equicursoris]|uniref:hypothetical protein n=1 Tax=Lactobacillus equicursoris TaxID=420645 RepID=UPI003991ED97
MGSSDSGESSGKQPTLEQEEYRVKEVENENSLKEHYFREVLAKRSPIRIPADAKISEKHGNYDQIRYRWTSNEYRYESRWHTRTPNAPVDQGDTWVVNRRKSGKGFGPNAQHAVSEIFVKTSIGGVWVSMKIWQKAISAKKMGVATKEQEELLKNGHWKDERR